MDFNDIVKGISDAGPQFNHYALKNFVRHHIDSSPEFIAIVFRQEFSYLRKVSPTTDLELVSYEVLSPEEQVRFELNSGSSKSTQRRKIPLTVSHLQLVRYRIRFGRDQILVHLYTPYVHGDMLVIRDKRQIIKKVILEKTFSRVQEKDKEGLTVSPTKVNMTFNRRVIFPVTSYVTGERFNAYVVTARMFSGKVRNRICETTVVHYMLAKFGFVKTLLKFGLSKNDVSFVQTIGEDTGQFDYFAAIKMVDNHGIPPLFLRVRKTLLGDDLSCKFIVNLLYILLNFRIQNIDNVYAQAGSVWTVMLGFLISEDRAQAQANTFAESHLRSVDFFIDPLTKDRFVSNGIYIEDMYDLLVYIFINIDSFMVNKKPQNLYDTRLDVSKSLLVKSLSSTITKQIYQLAKKTNIKLEDVKRALTFSPLMFLQPNAKRTDDDKDYLINPEIIGDNFLFAGGLNKIRMGGKPEQRFHPSIAVAESVNAIVGKTINKTGFLNPYIPTDNKGYIQHPDYAEAIDEISFYLPQ